MSTYAAATVEVAFDPPLDGREAAAIAAFCNVRPWWLPPCRGTDGKLVLENDDAGYLDPFVEGVARELSELPFPPDRWTARIVYDNDEYAREDGARVEIDIADGGMADWHESRVQMVEAPPWQDTVDAFARGFAGKRG